jgi:hypothetical protein
VDQHGKRRLKTFDTKKEAEAWKVNALHEIQIGVHTPASTSLTIEVAWSLWIADCEANGLELGTVRQRRQHLKHHVMPFIGRLRLSALTTPLAYDFDSKLRDGNRSLAMRRKVITNLKPCSHLPRGADWLPRMSSGAFASRWISAMPKPGRCAPASIFRQWASSTSSSKIRRAVGGRSLSPRYLPACV